MPDSNESENDERHPSDGGKSGFIPGSLTLQAFQLRSSQRYALHPIEAALQYHGASAEGSGASCDAAVGFEQAEGIYRAGTQGLRLSEIPQLPQQLRELSRLSELDRAGRKALRKWATDTDQIIDETIFISPTSIPSAAYRHTIYTTKTWSVSPKPANSPSLIPTSPLLAKAHGRPSNWQK
jgi:hypothetical protein